MRATRSAAASGGAVDAMHDSFMPLGGGTALRTGTRRGSAEDCMAGAPAKESIRNGVCHKNPRRITIYIMSAAQTWFGLSIVLPCWPAEALWGKFAVDSPLEGDGFELPVPRTTPGFWPISTTHNASRQMPQKGSSDQTVACFRRLGAGVVGSAAVCAFRFRPPGTGSKRAGWRRSGAFFGAVCFEPDASRARLRFKAVMISMTGGGAAISLGSTVSPFILASIRRLWGHEREFCSRCWSE